MEYLSVKYDSRQSFYGKALIDRKNGEILLISYETKVAKIDKSGKAHLFSAWDFSQTTLRHVKEFLKQYTPFFIGGKQSIEKLIKEGEIIAEN